VTDTEFLQALEDCTLPGTDFRHDGHVRACYLCLKSQDFAAGLARIRVAIRRYSAALGAPRRYHETITVASAALIQEAMLERGDGGDWETFARANPELLRSDLLLRFYSREQLGSEQARRAFVLPRRTPH
jgi:hypothetical protein